MEKILCETPTLTKDNKRKNPTRIDRWKYDLIAKAILEVLPSTPPGIPFKELPSLVGERLEDHRNRIGSIAWYTTTVKLDLEVKGKIAKVKGTKSQHLVKL